MGKKHLKETAILRRFAIIEVLRHEGTMHIGDLTQKFQVSKQTIHKDIDILTVCFNIQVKRGRYHSGVCLICDTGAKADTLNAAQVICLCTLLARVTEDERVILLSILYDFAPGFHSPSPNAKTA